MDGQAETEALSLFRSAAANSEGGFALLLCRPQPEPAKKQEAL